MIIILKFTANIIFVTESKNILKYLYYTSICGIIDT